MLLPISICSTRLHISDELLQGQPTGKPKAALAFVRVGLQNLNATVLAYRWPGWLSRMSDANLTRSMSRKACSPDNAACEGFFGRLKNELFYPRD